MVIQGALGWNGQGHLAPDWVVPSPVWTGLGRFQGWGIIHVSPGKPNKYQILLFLDEVEHLVRGWS